MSSGKDSQAQANAAMAAINLAANHPEAVSQVTSAIAKTQEGSRKAGGANVVAGAAAAGAVAGVAAGTLLVGAPVLLGVAGAATAAYLCTKDGETGDAARSAGIATNNIVHKTKELNEEHHITEKAKAATKGAIDKAKAFNEEHKVVEKATLAAKTTLSKAKEFDQKHDVSGKIGKGLLAGFNKLTDTLAPKDKKVDNSAQVKDCGPD